MDDDEGARASWDDPAVQKAIRQVRRVRVAHAVLTLLAFALLFLGAWWQLRG